MLDTMKIGVFIIIGLKVLNECCDCNIDGTDNDTVINSSMSTMGKRQLQNNDDDNILEIIEDMETTEINVTAKDNVKAAKSNEGSERPEDLSQATEINSNEANIKKLCRYYKKAPEFDYNKMADVWQLVYYKASAKLSCFKIHIKRVSEESKKKLYKKFGDFHHAVNWQNCQFEVASSSGTWDRQKHFLQGTKHKRGVLENIIVSRDEGTALTLLEQSPDQWLVIRNLLLMRDCDNGDVVVFSRVPAESSLRDIEAALEMFGEEANGNLACVE